MIRALTLALASTILLASPALADFEGVVEMNMTMASAKGVSTTGTAKYYITKSAIRGEMDMQNPELQKLSGKASIKTTTIQKLAEPHVLYHLNDEQKTYSVVDLSHLSKGEQLPEKKYTVKHLGRSSVAGYSCENYLVTGEDENENEICLSKDIGASSEWMAAMERRGNGAGGGWFKAIKEAGGEGFPIKMVMRRKGSVEPTTTIELTKVEKKSLPASLFEIPGDYRKLEFPGAQFMTPPGGAAAEQGKQTPSSPNDVLEKLPPEQRKMIEEMMKQRGGAK